MFEYTTLAIICNCLKFRIIVVYNLSKLFRVQWCNFSYVKTSKKNYKIILELTQLTHLVACLQVQCVVEKNKLG